jgi:hypothetical protein
MHSLDETAFVLVIDEIERVRCPSLLDLLDELFQCHFTLCLHHYLFDQAFVPFQVQVVYLTEGHAARLAPHSRKDERLTQRLDSQMAFEVPCKAWTSVAPSMPPI